MAYVITSPCASSACDNECLEVCPVDAIDGPAKKPRGSGLQLYIDPESCICCAACVSACPARAIHEEDDVAPAERAAIATNAAFFARRT